MHKQETIVNDITILIERIKLGEISPKASKIGMLFSVLATLNTKEHKRLLELYKPVAVNYFKVNPIVNKIKVRSKTERTINALVNALEFTDTDFNGDDVLIEDTKDKIIKEISDKIDGRVKKQIVPKEQKDPNQPIIRNRQAFSINGAGNYGKGKVVHAVVSMYIKENPNCTFDELCGKIFPNTLLRPYGIIKPFNDANAQRFFVKPEMILQVGNTPAVVCNQFTNDNIKPFIQKAKALGYIIEPIENQ